MDNINAQVIDADLIHEAILAIKACVVTSELPNVLTKTRKLDPSTGNIITEKHGNYPAGSVIKGYAENTTFRSMQEFAAFLDSAKTNQALIAAQHGGEPRRIKVMSKNAYEKAGTPADTITRTKENFIRHVNQQGLLILDCDDKSITKDKFLTAINKILPLDKLAHAYTTSSSSYLYVNGELKQGDKGKRLYIALKDANDTERAGAVLFDRLWLAGHGYYEIGAAGQFLNRGIIDTAMFKDTCRLDFISGSNCKAPVTQHRPPAEYNEGLPLDSVNLLPDLSKKELKELEAIQASKRAMLEGEATRVKTSYCERKGREHLAKQGNTTPTPEQLEQAKTNVLKALESSSLTGDFVITLAKDKSQVTIAEVLADPERYDQAECLDPLEPEYNNYSAVGKLFLTDGRPTLHTFAHGGKNYNLFKQSRFIQHVYGCTADTTNNTLQLMRILPNYYDMGGQLVTIRGGHVVPLNEHLLGYELGTVAQYYTEKTDAKGNVLTTYIDPPKEVVKQILSMGGKASNDTTQRGLKPLKAVITAPTITTDNHVVYKRGYDVKTGLYLAIKDDLSAPAANPTTQEVKTAYRALMDVIATFKLKNELDNSVVLSAFLSAVIRPAVETAPIFCFDAPTQGSGKTYLAECLGMLATGETPAMTPAIQGDEAEIKKTLLSMLVNNARVIVWDNIMGSFNSASLASFVTGKIFSGRVLGSTEQLELPNRAMLIFTGNNLSLYGDLPRRCITARIDTGEENPLNTKHDLTALDGLKPDIYIKRNRQRLAMACITIIRAYLLSEPHQTKGGLTENKVPSFNDWDVLARQPILNLIETGTAPQLQDIKESIDANMGNDPDKALLADLLSLLSEWTKAGGFTSKQLYDYAFGYFDDDPRNALKDTLSGHSADLRDVLQELCKRDKKITSRSLGSKLAYRKDRIANDLKLTVTELPHNRGNLFAVVHI